MRSAIIITAAIVMGLSLAKTAGAAETCGYSWAKPGAYTVEGNFRGRVERTRTRLSTACRIYFTVPGVFSGGPVQKSGSCLKFTFKVRNEPQIFNAQWCNGYAIIPWKGRNIRANVQFSSRQPDTKQRSKQRGKWN